MKKSKNTDVNNFLEKLESEDSEKFRILKTLREIVFNIHPKVKERIMYGGIMFTLDKDFGGIFSYQSHISFEFSNGVGFKDPHKNLEGSGKSRRHLKIESLNDIEEQEAAFYVAQAI